MVLEGRRDEFCFFESFGWILSNDFRYDVLNLQGNANDLGHHLHYVQVGTWSTGKLSLNTSAIRFFADQRSFEQINVRRFCSEACQNGHVKVGSHSFSNLFYSIQFSEIY